MTKIRTGQAPAPLTREQFRVRFNGRFYDPAFEDERDAIARLEAIAWDALQEGRKAPITRSAGRGFADPTYEDSATANVVPVIALPGQGSVLRDSLVSLTAGYVRLWPGPVLR